MDGERRGPRTGLEQLAVRGQRRVRPGDAPGARRPDRPGPAAPRSGSRRRSGTDVVRELLDADQDDEPGIDRAARAGRPPCATPSRGSTARTRPTPATSSRSPTTSSARASGSSAATAGPTTSASAAWTTSCRSGRNVNILVLDTEVYSNTGGQASKATPRGAVAKFAAAGKGTAARRTSARSPGPTATSTWPRSRWAPTTLQTTKALLEADAWPGPSLVIAYSTCIAHGIDMSKSMSHQKDAVKSGYWPLYRFHRPSEIEGGKPFKLDSQTPSIPVREFVADRDPLRGPRPDPPGAGRRARGAGPGRRRRALALLRAAGRRCDRSVPHVHQPDPDIVPEVESDAGVPVRREGDEA